MNKPKKLRIEDFRGFKYSPQTGILFRHDLKGAYKRFNGPVKTKSAKGYLVFNKRNQQFFVHRVAFVLMGQSDQTKLVDHINGVSSDNRWQNLRMVDNRINQTNQKRHRDQHRLPGTTWIKRLRKFQAMILIEGRKYHLGVFTTETDAHKAYKKAWSEYESSGKKPVTFSEARALPKGVVWHKRDKKYQACVKDGNQNVYLGYYRSPEKAEKAIAEYLLG